MAQHNDRDNPTAAGAFSSGHQLTGLEAQIQSLNLSPRPRAPPQAKNNQRGESSLSEAVSFLPAPAMTPPSELPSYSPQLISPQLRRTRREAAVLAGGVGELPYPVEIPRPLCAHCLASRRRRRVPVFEPGADPSPSAGAADTSRPPLRESVPFRPRAIPRSRNHPHGYGPYDPPDRNTLLQKVDDTAMRQEMELKRTRSLTSYRRTLRNLPESDRPAHAETDSMGPPLITT
ncbi:hypothetical protein F5Y17DRAFT_457507 [Xylariaceae sp. FL0594]|nr:hypothetical protein F5Y17DRAFT_457507 [Xylariaceae sp. FL0594]